MAKPKTVSLVVPMTPEMHAALKSVAAWRGCGVTEAAQEAVAVYCGGGLGGGGLAEVVISGHRQMMAVHDALLVVADFIASLSAADAAP